MPLYQNSQNSSLTRETFELPQLTERTTINHSISKNAHDSTPISIKTYFSYVVKYFISLSQLTE